MMMYVSMGIRFYFGTVGLLFRLSSQAGAAGAAEAVASAGTRPALWTVRLPFGGLLADGMAAARRGTRARVPTIVIIESARIRRR